MGNLKNLATSTVLTAPSPATSGTSLVVQSGEGARFPATPFYAIVHPDGTLPDVSNAEIVQVTNVSTDTLTIVRAQLSTTAKTIAVTWRISNPFLKEDYDAKQDLNANLTAISGLSPSNDDVLQRKAGAWTNRTPAQLKTDLALTKTDVGLSDVTNDAQIKSSNFPGSSVDSEIALFSSTTGKVIKRASVTGIAKVTSGVLSAATADTDYVTPTGTGILQNKTFDNTSPTAFFFPGMIIPYPVPTETAPAGWLLANGQAVSRTTYATLFNLLMPSKGAVTITNASPAVLTNTAHGLKDGDAIALTTTGTLPTGLTANTIYYVTRIDANTFKLSTTTGGVGVIYINTSSAGSGTHTLFRVPYGLGDGSTTFNVPDLRGRVAAGVEDMGSAGSASRLTGFANAPPNPKAIGNVGGTETHTLTVTQMPSHTHTPNGGGSNRFLVSGGGSPANITTGGGGYVAVLATDSTGGDGAHNNVQPTVLMNYLIKT